MPAIVISILKAIVGFIITPQGIGVGIGVLVLGYVLKRLDNTIVKGWVKTPFHWLAFVVHKFFLGIGIAITGGLSRWKWTKGTWNKYIEPYLIDLIDNIINGIVDGIVEVIQAVQRGLIEGLKSDNK